MSHKFLVSSLGLTLLFSSCSTIQDPPTTPDELERVDDWVFDENFEDLERSSGGFFGLGKTNSGPPTAGLSAPMAFESDVLGFSVGGAKDITNFRENIRNNYLPLPSDITYEGLFYDYFFDTGKQEDCEKL